MRALAIPVAVLATFAACAAVPSARALQEADYGPAPGLGSTARIRAAFAELLIDAGSAEFKFAEPEQGWGRDGSDFAYGWVVWTDVNSKNQFGAFTGWQNYKVLTRGGDVHSIYRPNGKDLFGQPKFDRLR